MDLFQFGFDLKDKFLSSTQLVNIFAVELAIHNFKSWLYNLQLLIYIVTLNITLYIPDLLWLHNPVIWKEIKLATFSRHLVFCFWYLLLFIPKIYLESSYWWLVDLVWFGLWTLFTFSKYAVRNELPLSWEWRGKFFS